MSQDTASTFLEAVPDSLGGDTLAADSLTLDTLAVDSLELDSLAASTGPGMTSWPVLGGAALFAALLIAIGLMLVRRRRKSAMDDEAPSSSFAVALPSGKVLIGNAQDRGDRKEQQDAFGFSDPSDEAFLRQYGVVAVLADGMGGMEQGADASAAAVRAFLEACQAQEGAGDVDNILLSALVRANKDVLSVGDEELPEGAIGTTLVAVAIHEGMMQWISVGDSRIYLASGETLQQLTEDHIYQAELAEEVEDGRITQEEAASHPDRYALTSFLGLTKLRHVGQSADPIPLHPGDKVLLCSDGLTGALSDSEIIEALRLEPQQACDDLVERVLEKDRPRQDNTTVMVMQFE